LSALFIDAVRSIFDVNGCARFNRQVVFWTEYPHKHQQMPRAPNTAVSRRRVVDSNLPLSISTPLACLAPPSLIAFAHADSPFYIATFL
jgi:hypothetical protein